MTADVVIAGVSVVFVLVISTVLTIIQRAVRHRTDTHPNAPREYTETPR